MINCKIEDSNYLSNHFNYQSFISIVHLSRHVLGKIFNSLIQLYLISNLLIFSLYF
jgi:hypothetical protein